MKSATQLGRSTFVRSSGGFQGWVGFGAGAGPARKMALSAPPATQERVVNPGEGGRGGPGQKYGLQRVWSGVSYPGIEVCWHSVGLSLTALSAAELSDIYRVDRPSAHRRFSFPAVH